jgi:2,4-dienoyl-CoA reductase-like NADH-dependent reductase (Old Yellow Enzyme family)/thioredoxin reductase
MINYPKLFSPGIIGTLETKNRIVMPAMGRNYADENGFVNSKYIAHIDRIARGGVGTMILEVSFVRPDGKAVPRQLGLHTDDAIPGLRQLAKVAHAQGAVIGPQLHHAGRQTSSKTIGSPPVAPSAIPDPTINEVPRALEVEEIREIVDAYAQAARRAKEAGCDFVELHGAHGYLITQFLSPYSNLRDDEYGGSDEKRMRFALEVVRAVRKTVGPGFPIVMRISADEMVPNGLTLADSVKIARKLEEASVDTIHVSVGNYASLNQGYMIAPMSMPDGLLVPFAESIKRSVGVPVIAVGKIRSPAMADGIIRMSKADFISIGRSLLADPDWPKKAQEGRIEDINKCIACNQGCVSRVLAGQDVWCTVNPETAHEEEFAKPLPEDKKRVLIAGGGPAGMEAARIAALRGHKVVLCEESDRLGGSLNLSVMLPNRLGWEELLSYLIREMDSLGVDVRLRTRATAELAEKEMADAAVVAVGASEIRPDIPGVQLKNVVLSHDILRGTAAVQGNVVVLGGGVSGALIADYLAKRGYDITLIGTGERIASQAAVAVRDLLLESLRKGKVTIIIDARIKSIESDRVIIELLGKTEELPADTVVVSMGSKPNDSIADELKRVVKQVYVVGDAVEPRNVTYAMLDGARAGLV